MTPPLSPQSSVLSPSGRGAIAVVRVWGLGAVEVGDRAFRPNVGQGLRSSPIGRLRVGRIGAGLGDEVVAVVVEGRSGLEVEVQCHGGPAAVALVVEALVEGGAKLRSSRAYARHNAGSSLKAEAELALATASTSKVAEILLDQAGGAFDNELRRILECSDDEALTSLDALIDRGRFGTRLVEGWRVVLAGRPNVGKSRLLNALSGYDRAIVAPEAGTTRDVVTVRTAFSGWPVELADTAGLRETSDPIEAQGVRLAQNRQHNADLVLVVLDRSEPLTGLDHAVLGDHPRALVVTNKSDLPPAWDDLPTLAVSAETGDGVGALIEVIAARLVPASPPPGSAVPFRSSHIRRLELIREALSNGHSDRARQSIERWMNM